jgi:hypothetical protein
MLSSFAKELSDAAYVFGSNWYLNTGAFEIITDRLGASAQYWCEKSFGNGVKRKTVFSFDETVSLIGEQHVRDRQLCRVGSNAE